MNHKKILIQIPFCIHMGREKQRDNGIKKTPKLSLFVSFTRHTPQLSVVPFSQLNYHHLCFKTHLVEQMVTFQVVTDSWGLSSQKSDIFDCSLKNRRQYMSFTFDQKEIPHNRNSHHIYQEPKPKKQKKKKREVKRNHPHTSNLRDAGPRHFKITIISFNNGFHM